MNTSTIRKSITGLSPDQGNLPGEGNEKSCSLSHLCVALSPMALCEPVDLERSFGQIAKIESSFSSRSMAFFLASAHDVERRQILNCDRGDREAFTKEIEKLLISERRSNEADGNYLRYARVSI